MCTSIAMRKDSFLFGRNMDIDYNFGEKVVITPRNFPLSLRKTEAIGKHYAFIGMAATADNYPLYADGMNENGLCIAALKFQDNARYNEQPVQGKANIAPYELIPWVLGKCRNICEAKTLLSETAIIAEPFSEDLPLSPLHWHIADKSGSIVLECTESGMNIYDNPADVLTNNPHLPFHLNNLSLYSKLTPDFKTENINFKPFGLGFGAIGLPGDFSPASRFVRAEYLLRNSADENDSVNQFFHILDNVSIPCGAVITPDGKYHITTYSCCMDTKNMTYYYKTYFNSALTAVRLTDTNSVGGELSEFLLKTDPEIRYCND